MKPVTKTVAIVVSILAVLFVAIVILGYVGILRVPGVSPSILEYSGTELTHAQVSQIISQSGPHSPSLALLESYGLTVHGYGTNDSRISVENYYITQTAGWVKEYSDSGPDMSITIWRNTAYGLGVAVSDSPAMKMLYGYKTVFVIIDGPASAWVPLLAQI